MSKTEEKGIVVGVVLISILLAQLGLINYLCFELGPIKPSLSNIVLGIYLQTWGLMFLAAYYLSYKTFFLRWLIWICENISYPRSRKMVFFYFVLAFTLGVFTTLQAIGLV